MTLYMKSKFCVIFLMVNVYESIAVCPTGTEDVDGTGKFCFWYETESVNFPQSRTRCGTTHVGGDLAILDSVQKWNTAISLKGGGGGTFVGLERTPGTLNYVWIDSTGLDASSYSGYWATNRPMLNTGDCVKIDAQNKLTEEHCTGGAYRLCEVRPVVTEASGGTTLPATTFTTALPGGMTTETSGGTTFPATTFTTALPGGMITNNGFQHSIKGNAASSLFTKVAENGVGTGTERCQKYVKSIDECATLCGLDAFCNGFNFEKPINTLATKCEILELNASQQTTFTAQGQWTFFVKVTT